MTIAHVRIDFLNHFLVQGVYIEDQAHDTLLYAGEAQIKITDWFIFKDKPALHYLGLQNTYVHLYRPASAKEWNYTFIEDAFSQGTKKDTAASRPFRLELQKIVFDNVRIHMDDAWGGEDMDFDVGSLAVNANHVDFDKKLMDVSSIDVKNTVVALREYKAGRPPGKVPAPTWEELDDGQPFNPARWAVTVKNIALSGCAFRMTTNDRVPLPDVFDENHLDITNLSIAISDVNVTGDTLSGQINHLTAHERCGLSVKDVHSKVSVSPVASICQNLYLETNYSKVQNYFAMHYRHFPDFTQYIDSVEMVAHIKDAMVDVRDIAYFAPELRQFPGVVLQVSGDGKGTVSDISGQHMNITDGSTRLTGNISMKGLPDIYKTYIAFTDGDIFTSGKGILRYAPALRNSKDVAIEQLAYVWFKGKYEGYIENFSVAGGISSNLGAVGANLKMSIPGFKIDQAVYSGSVTADKVQIGHFLRLPTLGNITLNEDFTGSSFNPDNAQLTIDGTIREFGINEYDYHNITTHDTLAKRQFKGTLLVDDPNLALEFDGSINYAGKAVDVKATAHLLGSNLTALNLTQKFTKDTITLDADFDLNCTASDVDNFSAYLDNFSGYAKLNNIDLRRNAHKLALDSVQAIERGDSLNKNLVITSNDATATIKGNYRLSRLSNSIQYYLSSYLPDYIRKPDSTDIAQDFSFTIVTTNIDSILAVTIPSLRGFDSSIISGSLNTAKKELTLNAFVPAGTVGGVRMTNIMATGQGDLDKIMVNATIDDVSAADSLLNGSLSATATLAHDSVGFTVATNTPDASTAITLKGQVVARKDSLFVTIFPSQFYLNQMKWDITGGSRIVYSDSFLSVQGFSITSGLQKVSAATQLENKDKSLIITAENLDLAQFGSWAGFASYQPDGRVNGAITIDKILSDMYVSAKLKATNVMLGNDTIGAINLVGNYNGTSKLITLDGESGIVRGDASVTASGKLSFDSATKQKLDGNIVFHNTPVAWASPFLAGIMSHLSGAVNGTVSFGGTAGSPEMKGDLTLTNGGMHLDFMGCNYTIPYALVQISNKRIELGSVPVFDSKGRTAALSGHFSHNLFKNMRAHLKLTSEQMEAMNLTAYDNNLFYGDLVAGMDSLTLNGHFNDMRLNIYNARPAAKSHIYIPESSGADAGSYNYVSFKTYGKTQEKNIRKAKDKFHINIDASLTSDAEIIIVLDPSTGDEIKAKGYGRIQLDVPPDNDMSINGVYTIENGIYFFSLAQLGIHKEFILENESTISFNGPFAETNLAVDAIYRTKAKLSDLMTDADKQVMQPSDLTEAQTPQWVDVVMHISGSLLKPSLTFDLDLEDKHSQNNLAYQKLRLINADPRQQFAQVGALLLISQFIPPEGLGSGTAITGAVNNFSQLISSSASTGLTTIINKLTHDRQLNVTVNYTNYNYSDATLGGINRSQVKVDVNKSYLNDRLLVELGSTSDWGHPTSASSASNFNLTGDFRLQYQIAQGSNFRINAFRTSDYDVTLDRDIVRNGVGMSWRRSFDNLPEFFHGKKYFKQQQNKDQKKEQTQQDTTKLKKAAKTE